MQEPGGDDPLPLAAGIDRTEEGAVAHERPAAVEQGRAAAARDLGDEGERR